MRGDQSLLVPAWSQTWLIFNSHLSQDKQYKENHFRLLGRTDVTAHMAEGAAECWEGERRVAQA